MFSFNFQPSEESKDEYRSINGETRSKAAKLFQGHPSAKKDQVQKKEKKKHTPSPLTGDAAAASSTAITFKTIVAAAAVR